jgi:hypothetical protein
MSRPVGVRKALPIIPALMAGAKVVGGAIARGAAKAGATKIGQKVGQVAVEGAKKKLEPKSMAQTGMEMQQKRAEMQQQKNQAQMSSAQDMADKAKAGASVAKGEYVHPSVQQHIQNMYNDLDGSGRPLPQPNNLPEGYSGVSRQNMENIFAQNRDGSFSFATEQQNIPAQNLPPKIEPEVEVESESKFDPNAEPSFEGRLQNDFYEGKKGHGKLRLFGKYRIDDDKQRQEVIDRIHSALNPYLDKDGNYKKDVPTKEFAIRTHLLDNIMEAKRIPREILRQHNLSPANSLSEGDSIIAIVKPHENMPHKPQLTTVMYRKTPFIRGGQPFKGENFGDNNTKTINAHGLTGNQFKEHVARRQAIDGRRSANKQKSEPMDLAWELLTKGSVELHHNEELPQEFIDDIMMLDRTHKMTPTNNGTLIEDIDPFMQRTIQLMAENYKEENPTVVEPRNQHLFH